MVTAKVVKIKALKYPDRSHYEWDGELLYSNSEYAVLLSRPGRGFIHHTRKFETTLKGTYLQYFSFKDWFNVLMEVEDGRIVSYYCNIAMPATLIDHEINFVDLDLDFVREKNEDKWEVLDEDEFEINSIKFKYPHEIKDKAKQALKALKKRVKNKNYPFNNQILEDYNLHI